MKKAVQYSFKRYEKKYLLSESQYTEILKGMSKYIKPDIYGETVNCNIYYDTDTYSLIRKSIEKPVYKEKLRIRSYSVPKNGDKVYIELKKKFDGIVYKRRIGFLAENAEKYLSGDEELSPNTQISMEIEYFQKIHNTKPKVFIAYDRTSFVGRENDKLRITFDKNIRFREYALDLRKGDFGKNLLEENGVLMEIKIPDTTPLWLAKLLSELKIKPTSFSKYGTYYKEYVLAGKGKEIKRYA